MTYLTESRGCFRQGPCIGPGKTDYEDADALIASGAVIDASALADDEALVAAIAADQKEAADSWGDPLPGAERNLRARTALRALAAALTERSQR